ncbi:hypothetical protein POTOM_006191 [Populus tomentosa]|uniref:Pentatricopeptide repeat-containing protein n=1 Tax=Populus tomentosa TaxID=118781 RepID=A0A8X8AIG6_POPTO|nr:hypothetical protein POTOM_006191 [Populus tomentosa]
MQALSVLPLSGGLCTVVRHLEFEVDSSCLLSARRRRKKCGSFFCEKNGYKDGLTSYLEGSFGSSLAMASALGQQEIGDAFHTAIPSLDDQSSLKHERDNSDNDLERNDDSIQAYSSMIRGFGGRDKKMEHALARQQGQAKMILDVLEEMRMKGFSPSAASQCSALLTYGEKEGGNGALKFFVELKEKHLKREIGRMLTKIGKRNM